MSEALIQPLSTDLSGPECGCQECSPSWLRRLAKVLGVLAGVVILWRYILVPAFQPPIDPNLTDLSIRRTGPMAPLPQEQERKAHGPLRGSTTDMLFDGTFANPEHPLDPALGVARKGLERFRAEVRDYTALLVKQERVNGKLMREETMRVKVRQAREENGKKIPKSFYIHFEKPRAVTGREVIWVEGRNDNCLTAHEGGIKNLMSVNLAPDSFLAMSGNRYPITELGLETLLIRMIEKGERDRNHGPCEVTIDRDIEIDGNPCTLITITHAEKKEPYEYHQSKIYVDDERDMPVGYEGFDWPKEPGGEPVLVERYFYRELKVNVGLTDRDFDTGNPDYNFR